MGAPFGLDFSVTEGIVSSTARQIPIGFGGVSGQGITQKAIQTDAAINPGNSGGRCWTAGAGDRHQHADLLPGGSGGGVGQSAGVGFAIPIDTARNLLPRLQAAQGAR